MSKPPDKICINLVPNPDDDNSRAEEERRQKAIRELIFLEAKKAGIEVHATGEIDPIAEENPERLEEIKADTQPKLVEFTAEVGRSLKADEVHKPDGTIYKGLKAREASTIKLSVNMTDLVNLGHKIADLIGDTQTAVIKLGARILSAVGVGSGGDDDPDSEATGE